MSWNKLVSIAMKKSLDKDGLEHYLKGEFRNKHLDFLYFKKTKDLKKLLES